MFRDHIGSKVIAKRYRWHLSLPNRSNLFQNRHRIAIITNGNCPDHLTFHGEYGGANGFFKAIKMYVGADTDNSIFRLNNLIIAADVGI